MLKKIRDLAMTCKTTDCKKFKLHTCFSFTLLEFLQQRLVDNACVVLYPEHNKLSDETGKTNQPAPSAVRYRADMNFHLNFLYFFVFFSILSHDCKFAGKFFKWELRDLKTRCFITLSTNTLHSGRANFRWKKNFFCRANTSDNTWRHGHPEVKHALRLVKIMAWSTANNRVDPLLYFK